jgi:aryl-alcohol dehydrogenase-like predicted oxidoreductase
LKRLGTDYIDIYEFHEPDNQTAIDVIDKVVANHSVSMAQTALNYVLRKPGLCSIITGVRNIEQLTDSIKAADWELTPEEVDQLDRISEPPQEYPYRVFDPEAGCIVKF